MRLTIGSWTYPEPKYKHPVTVLAARKLAAMSGYLKAPCNSLFCSVEFITLLISLQIRYEGSPFYQCLWIEQMRDKEIKFFRILDITVFKVITYTESLDLKNYGVESIIDKWYEA